MVAAFEFTGTVTWYQNMDGLGGFSSGADIATDAPGATWVTVADLDDDGDLDVVSASSTDGTYASSVGFDVFVVETTALSTQ